MAIQIGLGVPIMNHRWADATVDSTIADGWTKSAASLTLSHTYDTRGFGVQQLLATAAISTSTANYIQYRTEAIGSPGASKYSLAVVAQTSKHSTSLVYYKLIGQTNATTIHEGSLGFSASGTPELLVFPSASSQGVTGDTYYDIRLGAYTLDDTETISFSRTVTLQHTFDTDAAYKTMTVNPQVDGSVIGNFGFAQYSRDAAGHGRFSDGTAGERKGRLVLPFKHIPQTDLAWLEQFYYHTRSTKAADSNRWLVVRDTSLPAVADNILGTAQINPNYYCWTDQEFPFNQPSNSWFPSDSKFQGVMNLEEP